MGDQMAEMGAKFAVSAAVEVFKECLKGIKGVSEWIGSQAGRHDPLDRAAKNYVKQFAERYNVMRIFGMDKPIPLTDIYVRVNVLERITARQWTSFEDLEEAFDRDSRGFGIPKQSKAGIDIAKQLRKFIVLGKPGSGKTTYLKYIGIQAFNARLDTKLIPIFISLRDFADSEQSMMDFIMKQFDICRFPKGEEFVERLLEEGRCILLLDGLDEVGKDKSNEVIREVRDFSDKYSDDRFVLSCRIAAYNWQFEKFTDTELADFTDEQIENFIDSWFGKDSKKATSCWAKLCENTPIKELASVPLLLTLLCITFDENMEFPKNKAELYKDAIDALLRKWDSSRSIERDEIYKGLSTRRKEAMFSRIAAETFNEGRFFIPHRTLEKYIADFIENLAEADQETLEPDSEGILKAIGAQHGIFVERAKGIYSFSHLTFQEYFTARYIVDNEARGALQGLVANHLTDARWREVFLIATGMLVEADDFFLMIKEQIDTCLIDTELAEFLKDIQADAVKADLPFSPSASRAMVVWYIFLTRSHGLDRARDLVDRAGAISRALDVLDRAGVFARARAFASASDLDRALASVLDRALVTARAFDFENTASIGTYLRANQVLVDCLNTDCYVSRDTRQKILNELLTVPESLTKSESS